jgi:ubiquitin carboxyl-terminal hydrolase 36/42
MVEVIEGYKCEKCKDESEKHRVQLIGHAPDILAVQLKRFRWDGAKDSSFVGINPSLDLDKYRDTHNLDSLKYELTAVIKHGGGARFGHYICCAKGPDGAWYDFNDMSVTRINIGEATSTKSGFTPYLMFYQRKET